MLKLCDDIGYQFIFVLCCIVNLEGIKKVVTVYPVEQGILESDRQEFRSP